MNQTQYDNVIRLCETLESGKYKKGKGHLKSGDYYCCLGVACDISGLGEWKTTPFNGDCYEVSDVAIQNSGTLPEVVQEYYGFTDDHGIRTDIGSLVNLNDGVRPHYKEYTHPEIAGIIREWLATQVIE